MRKFAAAIPFIIYTATTGLYAQQHEPARNGLIEKRDHRGVIKEASYYRNDTLHGQSIKYFDNGNIFIKVTYANGLPDGDYFQYDSRGRQTIYGHFTHGVRDVFKSYWSNGNVRISASFRDGFIEDECITYYKNGKLESRVVFEEGKILLGLRTFDKKGRVRSIAFPLSTTRDVFVYIEYLDKKGTVTKRKAINDRPMSYYLFGPDVHQSGELTGEEEGETH